MYVYIQWTLVIKSTGVAGSLRYGKVVSLGPGSLL